MTRSFSLTFIFCLFIITTYSTAQEVSFEKVKKLYETFEYQSFIKTADELIQKETLSDSLMIEIYLMRVNVFYTYNDIQSTRKNFESILKIRKNYLPDPASMSPDLISIFGDVKTEYIRNHPDMVQPKDSTQVKSEMKFTDPRLIRNAIIQNIVLPGLGQLYLDNKTKGWITTAVSTINFGTMIYFIFDAKSKEDAYLKESNKSLIQQKYNDYNSSYKTRNILIASYVAIWLYGQIDMLFFSSGFESTTVKQTPDLTNNALLGMNLFRLNFQIPLN